MPRPSRADVRPVDRSKSGLGICVVVAALTLAPAIACATESWEILLQQQLLSQQRCVLDSVLAFREVPVGSIVGLEGRVRCADRREFDFKRDRPNEKFTIRLCEPAVC